LYGALGALKTARATVTAQFQHDLPVMQDSPEQELLSDLDAILMLLSALNVTPLTLALSLKLSPSRFGTGKWWRT
jgi:hypothetical protein